LNVDKSGKSKFCCKYDSSYRLLQASDSEDRLVKMIYEEGQIRPKTISDCMGNEKNYTYDHRGNIVRILDSGGTEQRFWYNQNDQLFAYLDGRGRAELYSYNEQGRLSKICHFAQLISDDPENGKVNFNYSQSHVTEYDYEPNSGRLQWIKRGPDLVQSFAYNQEGLLIATTSPAGHTLHRSYDQRGRLSRLWDPQEEGFEYCYDNRDRLIRLSSHDGMIEYRYDDIGNLSSIQDACGAITYYSFDSFGNLLKIEDPAGGQTRYEYDESHNLKRIILPNGSIREIDYDAVNRPKVDSW
jgi:YD repeat-containing protein